MCTVCVQWDDMQIGLGAGTTLPLVEHCIGVHHGDCDDLYFETSDLQYGFCMWYCEVVRTFYTEDKISVYNIYTLNFR